MLEISEKDCKYFCIKTYYLNTAESIYNIDTNVNHKSIWGKVLNKTATLQDISILKVEDLYSLYHFYVFENVEMEKYLEKLLVKKCKNNRYYKCEII